MNWSDWFLYFIHFKIREVATRNLVRDVEKKPTNIAEKMYFVKIVLMIINMIKYPLIYFVNFIDK